MAGFHNTCRMPWVESRLYFNRSTRDLSCLRLIRTCYYKYPDPIVHLRRSIAALSLLTSVLLGGLVAPLSHFAFMAFSDSYAMHMAPSETHAMNGHVHDVSFTEDHSPDHLECPFAAFFLSQSSAIAADAPGLVSSLHVVSVLESTAVHHVGASLHVVPARGPPQVSA